MAGVSSGSGLDGPLQAQTGTRVLVELVDERGLTEQMDVTIVADDFADVRIGYLGQGTPLARALEGHIPGDCVDYRMGELRELRILAVSLAEKGPDAGVSERRQEILRKAAADSDRINAILFASSFNGKWGDYDPSSLVEGPDGEDPVKTA